MSDLREVVYPCPERGCTEGLRVTVDVQTGQMIGYHGATVILDQTIPEPASNEFRELQAYARANDVWSFEFARGVRRVHGQWAPSLGPLA